MLFRLDLEHLRLLEHFMQQTLDAVRQLLNLLILVPFSCNMLDKEHKVRAQRLHAVQHFGGHVVLFFEQLNLRREFIVVNRLVLFSLQLCLDHSG
jgi:hypothetical protein